MVLLKSITDLLTMARDRKEIAYGSNKRDRTLLSDDKKEQDPLQPYEWLSYDEWSALSSERREEMSAHNTRIEKAAESLAKMGWTEGRWKKKTKPSDSLAQKYLTAIKKTKGWPVPCPTMRMELLSTNRRKHIYVIVQSLLLLCPLFRKGSSISSAYAMWLWIPRNHVSRSDDSANSRFRRYPFVLSNHKHLSPLL